MSEGFIRTSNKDLIFDYIDKHPNCNMHELKRVFNYLNPATIKTNFYRWKRKHQPKKKKTKVSKKQSSPIKRKKPPTNLSKLDEDTLKTVLLHIINNGEWDLNLVREIRQYLTPKDALKKETKETPEFMNMNFKEIYDGAKSIISNNEREVPS